MRFYFKSAKTSDRPLIHAWLKQPHISEWFYGQGLQNTIDHLDQFLEGNSSAQYFIGYEKSHPFAFFITSKVSKPNDPLTKWCSKEGEAITLDLFIGDLHYLGKGLSTSLIGQFLFSTFGHVSEVLIDPESTNTRAIHVYQKVGFKKLGSFIPTHSPHLHDMMRLDMKKDLLPLFTTLPSQREGETITLT